MTTLMTPTPSTTADPAEILPALDNTLGALLIGGFICAVFYGIVCLQTFLLLRRTSRDECIIRYVVWTLWVVNTAHLALTIHPCYWYMVSNYFHPDTIDRITWSISAGVVLTGLNDALVRSSYIYRIWILSQRNRPLTAFLTCCVAFALALTMLVSGQSHRSGTFSAFRRTSQWVLSADMALVFASDVILALLLCFYLARSRNKVCSRRIGSYLNLLLVYTINTGLLTSMVAMGCLITFVKLEHSFIFVAFYFPMSSLYANSLLASLNMRDFYGNRQEFESISLPISRLDSCPSQPRMPAVAKPPGRTRT